MDKVVFRVALLLLLASLCQGLSGQESVISGHITDDKGLSLDGASVSVIGRSEGTLSDVNGRYRLMVAASGKVKIRFSYTGFIPVVHEIILPGSLTLDVSLTPLVITTDEIVVSATRASTKTPVAYSAVSSEEIRKKTSAADLPFLLGSVPSLVETSEAGTGTGYTSLRIRGSDGSRINVTIDGIPLNDAESQQVFWVDLPDLAASVDNIQVQRGVGTSANGAGAFGASINIKTKNPGDEPFAEISSMAGSFNTFRNSVAAGSGLLAGRFGLQLRYSDIKSDGYIRRTFSDNRSASVSGIIKGDRSVLRANILLGEEHTGISWWGVPYEMLDSDRRYNPAGEYTDENGIIRYYDNETDNYRQNHYQLIFSSTLAPSLYLHTAIHYTSGNGFYEEYREDQMMTDYGLPLIAIDSLLISETDLIRQKWMDNDFYGMVYSLTLQKERLKAIAGGGVNRYEGDHFGKIIWMQYAGNTDKDHMWYLNSSRKSEVSIYGKLNYEFGERLSAFCDLQYRHIAYRMMGGDDDLRDITQSHSFSFFNPKAGVFYSPSSNHDAYLSFSVAGREPTRSDFKEASGDIESTPSPETLYDIELGYSFRNKRADIGINLYYMYYHDQLIPTGELSDVGYPIMTNVKSSYRSGIELTAAIKPIDRLSWKLSVTVSRNKIRDFTAYYLDYNTADWSSEYRSRNLGTVDIAYSPSVISSSDLSYNLTGKISAHFVTKYVGSQFFDNTMSQSRKMDPYLVNNFTLDFTGKLFGKAGVNTKLMINNIFNSMYSSNAYGGMWFEDGAEQSWSYWFPQAGINLMLGINLRF